MKKAILILGILAFASIVVASFDWNTNIVVHDYPVELYATWSDAQIGNFLLSTWDYNASDVISDGQTLIFPYRYVYAEGYNDENGTLRIMGIEEAQIVTLDVPVVAYCMRVTSLNACRQTLVSGTTAFDVNITGVQYHVEPLMLQYYTQMGIVYQNMKDLRTQARYWVNSTEERDAVNEFLQGISIDVP